MNPYGMQFTMTMRSYARGMMGSMEPPALRTTTGSAVSAAAPVLVALQPRATWDGRPVPDSATTGERALRRGPKSLFTYAGWLLRHYRWEPAQGRFAAVPLTSG